uniref:Uncharacterized protein n=1 Tax=Oryza brachyantha TaxID=4533 RepID=J3MDM4_ORYBR
MPPPLPFFTYKLNLQKNTGKEEKASKLNEWTNQHCQLNPNKTHIGANYNMSDNQHTHETKVSSPPLPST